jgi:integrase/recombinase XerD
MTKPLDPKKDPARRCLKIDAWPELDQQAWLAGLDDGDFFEPQGTAARWKPRTQKKVSVAYGRWLTWLDRLDRLDRAARPADRVTPTNVGSYIEDLGAIGNSPYTVLGRVRDLHNAMKAMEPDRDWGWLQRLAYRLRRRVRPVRNKRARVLPSYELWQFGLELMEKAEGPDGGSPFARASAYRSGLMVSLLAARPLRRRNFASIEIGRHLVKEGDQYSLHFEGAETKTGAVIDNPFPATLVPYLERYLAHYRPFLAQRTGRWRNRIPDLRPPGMNLWVSDYASAMSEGAIYEQIRNLTRAKFGRGLGPHMFRDCAATSVATEDPEHVLIVPSLLGHSSLRTSQEYYDHAQSNYAVRRYQQHVLARRRQSDAGEGHAGAK